MGGPAEPSPEAPEPSPSKDRAGHLAAIIFLAVAAIYLLAGSRERPWGDAQVMYETASSLAKHGTVDIQYEWPPMSHRGSDGRIYGVYGLGASLVSVPGVWLLNLSTWVAPMARPLTLPLSSHLAPALLGALVCVLFFRLARRVGGSTRSASVATAVLAFATGIFVYARYPFSEIAQVAAFTGLLDATLAASELPSRRHALAVGLWGGALVNVKLVFALSLVGAALVLVLAVWRDRRALLRVVGFGLAGFVPLAMLVLAYDQARWGSPFETGYGPAQLPMREALSTGLWGLLLSPGKSLFLLSPLLVVALVAWPRFARSQRRAALAVALLGLPLLLYYAKYLGWAGNYGWGPRYIAFLIPAALLPLVGLLDRLAGAARGRRRAGLAAIALVAVLGAGVQILGNAFYWDHWIRLARDASVQWLGHPNRKGAVIAEAGRGHCDSCFEDMHPIDWLPPFSALTGHAWLLGHVARGDGWQTAEADAPWRRYTSLRLNIRDSYARVRLDWWGLIWMKDAPGLKPLGATLLGLFAAAAALGVWLWIRATSTSSRGI